MKTSKLSLILISVTLAISILTMFMTFGLRSEISAINGGVSSDSGTASLITPNDPFIGPDNAKNVIIEFSDFECPYCGAASGTHAALIDQFKRSDPTWEAPVPKLEELAKQGKIKFVFKNFPLNIHKNAQKAAEASECANEQKKFWEYHNKMFENQEALDVPSLKQYAKDLGLNTNKFNDCLDTGKMAAEVKNDLNAGVKAGISGTPAFLVNGQLIKGAQSFSTFESMLS